MPGGKQGLREGSIQAGDALKTLRGTGQYSDDALVDVLSRGAGARRSNPQNLLSLVNGRPRTATSLGTNPATFQKTGQFLPRWQEGETFLQNLPAHPLANVRKSLDQDEIREFFELREALTADLNRLGIDPQKVKFRTERRPDAARLNDNLSSGQPRIAEAAESKVGSCRWNRHLRQEALADAFLQSQGTAVTWHFFAGGKNNEICTDPRLFELLTALDIPYVMHLP